MAFNDPFFGRVGLQLIHAPQTSQDALSAAIAGNPPRVPPGGAVAIDMSRAWTSNILRDPYHPKEDTPFVAFRREAGLFDVVRTRNLASGLELDVAQTFSMFSVVVNKSPAKSAETDIARVERVANLLLKIDPPLDLETIGQEGNGTYGKRRVPIDPLNCDWKEILRWWCSPDEVGFLTVKTTKSPERAVVSVDEDDNIRWFEFYLPR